MLLARADGAHVHRSAHVHPSATLAPGVLVADGAYIGPRCQLGPSSYAGPGVHIGEATQLAAHVSLEHCRIGRFCLFHAGVSVGADGFGFLIEEGRVRKKPQLLRVVIGDYVEVGAGSCIDRGSWRDTMVGDHTKLDNQVQLGHNVRVGRSCLLCAHVALGGSSHLGDFCVLGGKSAVADHVTLTDRVRLAACAGATKHITESGDYGGLPAQPISRWRREVASLRRLVSERDLQVSDS